MTQIRMDRYTANELAEVKVQFLRALRGPGGVDVSIEEQVQTGTFDTATDTITGGVLTVSTTTFVRGALVVPLRSTEVDRGGGTGKATFALGNELGDVPVTQVMVLKIRPEIPLTETAIYLICGQRYRFDRVINAASLGPRKPLWNLASFRKA